VYDRVNRPRESDGERVDAVGGVSGRTGWSGSRPASVPPASVRPRAGRQEIDRCQPAPWSRRVLQDGSEPGASYSTPHASASSRPWSPSWPVVAVRGVAVHLRPDRRDPRRLGAAQAPVFALGQRPAGGVTPRIKRRYERGRIGEVRTTLQGVSDFTESPISPQCPRQESNHRLAVWEVASPLLRSASRSCGAG
jgi:hypothetical protein